MNDAAHMIAVVTSCVWLAGVLKLAGRHISLQCNADWPSSQSSGPSILCCGYRRPCCEHHLSACQHHKWRIGLLCLCIRRRIILPMPLPECQCWHQPRLCKLYITSVSLQFCCHSFLCRVCNRTVGSVDETCITVCIKLMTPKCARCDQSAC